MAFNTFNRDSLRLRPAMHKMESDLKERDRRWWADERDPYDASSEKTWEQRMPPDDEYNERVDTLKRVGIKVQTHVRWGHLMHPPSLMIYVDDLPLEEQPFVNVRRQDAPDIFKQRYSRWTSEATTNPAVHRHITICNAEDLRSFDHWRHKLYYLYTKFDDKALWLYPKHVTSGSTLELDDQLDPIASDPVVQELHSKTLTHNKQEDGSWTSTVAPLHISM